MELKRSGSQPSQKGREEYFTGNVRLDPLSHPPEPAGVALAPSRADADRHTRLWMGQSIVGPKVEIRAGDVVWCPPNERHWHGATSTTAMSHIAIQEALDGKVVEWLEKVSDEQYKSPEME